MGRYRMKAVSHMLGVRPELLRMWEKRYHLFKPQRAGNRYREFDEEDVQLLRYICAQLAQGRAIGELAAEGRETLLRQMAAGETPAASGRQDYAALIEEFLTYIQRFDQRRCEARLAECAVLYSFATLMQAVMTPLMYRVGDLWAAGHLSTASEHLATVLFKQRLLTMLQATAPRLGGPVCLCACPAGEWHELGLLTFAYVLHQEGWQVCYLGPNLPIDALCQACEYAEPALVALSLTYAPESAQGVRLMQDLEQRLAVRYPTYLGGQAVGRAHRLFSSDHVRAFASLQEAQDTLARLAEQRQAALAISREAHAAV